MSASDDSSFEMNPDSINGDAFSGDSSRQDTFLGDTAELLLRGEIPGPEFVALATVLGDLRRQALTTPTPAVRGALAEYVGVDLTTTEMPATPAPAVASQLDLTAAAQPRSRRSVIAAVMTFAGTMTGKMVLGCAVAAASVTGANATGVVDVPGLDGSDSVGADESGGTEGLQVFEVPTSFPTADGDATDDPSAEALAGDKEEVAPVTTAPPTTLLPTTVPPTTVPPKTTSTTSKTAKDQQIAVLESQLHANKKAVHAAARAQIEPLEAQKHALVQQLNATLAALETARNDAKAPLYAERETTTDPIRLAQIEAELHAIYSRWEADRDAATAAATPAIDTLKAQMAAIERARDAEITRLLNEFHAAVAAL